MKIVVILIWTIIEAVKFIIVTKGILGFELQKDKAKRKYFIFVYMFAVIIYGTIKNDYFLYQTLLIYVLVLFLYEEKLSVKIESAILTVLSIDSLDLLVWSVLINIFPQMETTGFSKYISNLIGVLYWMAIAFALRKKRDRIHEYFVSLSFKYYVLIILIYLGFALVAGGIHYTISGILPMGAQRLLLVIFMLTMIMVMIEGGLLIYTIISKRNLARINETQNEYFKLQQKYYEEKIQNNEQLQKLHHDIKKHMKVMHMLCKENKIKELQEYLTDYINMYPEQNLVSYTGNMIVDYFICETISELSGIDNFNYQVLGKFPRELCMENLDLCTLMANALENARNAILKVRGSAKLYMEIKNYNEYLIIDMENSCEDENANMNSRKKQRHGYGLNNMRDVVEKYNGIMEARYEGGMFYLHIRINCLLKTQRS